jgi:flavin reductase (DIM6/NTAB) family NADH-FMN oxidoreductase RutF
MQMTLININPDDLSRPDRYKLICGLVIPRPIALVTTVSENRVVNAAPFSFFNVFSDQPTIVALGVNSRPDGGMKDIAANINYTKEFVVHMVTKDIAEQMNVSCVNFPPDISEIKEANFTLKKSYAVNTPSIKESLVALECKLHSIIPLGIDRNITLGEVINIATTSDVVDVDKNYINIEKYQPIARLFGNMYASISDIFQLKRLNYQEWMKDKDNK